MIKAFRILIIILMVAGCSNEDGHDANIESVQNDAQTANSKVKALNQLAENYFEESLKLDPFNAVNYGDYRFNDQFGNIFSSNYISASKALVNQSLSDLSLIDRASLNEDDQITYDVLEWELKRKLEGFAYNNHLLPINQYRSRINTFVRMGSGNGSQPFNTPDDYHAFIKKANGFAFWIETVIQRMREGMEKEVVLPKALVQKMLPQLSVNIVSDVKRSLYWQPIKIMPSTFSSEEKAVLERSYQELIANVIVPAYRKLHDFIQNEYIQKARESSGYNDLPNGDAWYQYWITEHTTTAMTADEIQKMGYNEVAHILSRMEEVRKQVGFKGNLRLFLRHMAEEEGYFFKSSDELINAYTVVRRKIEAVIPRYFDFKPKLDYEIRPVESFRAATSSGASYRAGSPDGSRPGVFYINTHNLKTQPRYLVETLSVHEASPGHHFQQSIQIELKDIPKIRRFKGNTAFEEGWALYAEFLGKEMGLYSDPYQYYGHLSDGMLRAMRLVVDTGLHAKGWSREQAIRYMQENSSMAEADIIAEVERYMAIPGQALAYKIGEIKIRELRHYAESAFGNQFDIRAFHRKVLSSGSLPLQVLENKIKNWVASQRVKE